MGGIERDSPEIRRKRILISFASIYKAFEITLQMNGII